MTDKFKNYTPEIEGPAEGAFLITPHDVNLLAISSRGIYIGGNGNITVVMVSGEEVTFVGCLAGSIIPIRCKQVKSTGTTASNLIGMY